KCLEICPTQALEASRELNATKCISYLTIESRSVPPESLRKAMGDWFFGCDLCQTVCPWNLKFVSRNLERQPQRTLDSLDRQALTDEMNWILSTSGKALQRAFHQTALSRAGSFGLKRNALVVIANQKLIDCREEVVKLSTHPKLGELAEWCLKELCVGPDSISGGASPSSKPLN
ncbi:MAG: 4Fe-4S double cluster binding domain-containing protein, partial [Bdellovibrio sp.]